MYVLRGIFSAANSNYSFEKLFKWFYPTYLQQVLQLSLPKFTSLNGIFAQFEDETQRKVIIQTSKLLKDLLDNSQSRLRFDNWSISGFILFKESAQWIGQVI